MVSSRSPAPSQVPAPLVVLASVVGCLVAYRSLAPTQALGQAQDGPKDSPHTLVQAPAPSEVSVVLVTVPADARHPWVEELLQRELVACVNEIPGITSTYRWQGKVESSAERLLVLKTATPLVAKVVEFVEKHHPYVTPEVLAWPVGGGSSAYLNWVLAETTRTHNNNNRRA